MSINWDRLMTLDQFAPHEIANAVRMAVELPPGATFNDLMHVMHVEKENTDNVFKEKLLGFCIAIWYYKMMKGKVGGELDNKLASVANASWKSFIGLVPDDVEP